MTYQPQPIATDAVPLTPELELLIECLSASNHDHWAQRRLAEGWTLGPTRNDRRKTHPGLVPYAELPEEEKEYDRTSVCETVKAILALGFEIRRTSAHTS
jgi:RyR domain